MNPGSPPDGSERTPADDTADAWIGIGLVILLVGGIVGSAYYFREPDGSFRWFAFAVFWLRELGLLAVLFVVAAILAATWALNAVRRRRGRSGESD